VTSGTYTFTNVVANHTIVATFTATGFSITPSAGPIGSITPNTVQTVPSGGNSPTFTITPNAGYHISTVLVDSANNPAAVTSGAYSFTNVTANHTIAAAFETDSPAVVVTAPTGTGSYVQGSTVAVSWTTTPAVAAGEFGVWAVASNGGWYVGHLVPANGTGANSFNLPLNVPAGTGYSTVVMYRPVAGSGAWTTGAYSTGTFDVTATFSLNVTAPTGTGSYTVGSPVTVNWTASSIVGTGEFGVWAVASNGAWYGGYLVPANGASASYTFNMPLNVPIGTGYSTVVMYRATAGFGAWTTGAYSPGTFSVN
jgi:hypothetical protein